MILLLKHVSLDADISISFSIPQNSAFCMILTSFGGRWDSWNFDIGMLAALSFPLERKRGSLMKKENVQMYLKKKGLNNKEELHINIRGNFLCRSHLIKALMAFSKMLFYSIKRKHVANWPYKLYHYCVQCGKLYFLKSE